MSNRSSRTASRSRLQPEAYQVITGRKKTPFLGVLLTYAATPALQGREGGVPPAQRPGGSGQLGVLGAGLFANATLLPAIKKIKAVELVAVASAGGLHARHSAQKFGFAYAASDDQQILEDAQINTVAILTRHDTHATWSSGRFRRTSTFSLKNRWRSPRAAR